MFCDKRLSKRAADTNDERRRNLGAKTTKCAVDVATLSEIPYEKLLEFEALFVKSLNHDAKCMHLHVFAVCYKTASKVANRIKLFLTDEMVLYKPRLANGRLAPLSWPLAAVRCLNQFIWPLEEDVGAKLLWTQRVLLCFGYLIFVQHNDAELRFVYTHIDNVDEMLTGIPTYLILTEAHIRFTDMALNQVNTRNLLKKLFAEIYVERKLAPDLFRVIQRQMLPAKIMAVMYMCALNTFFFTLLVGRRKRTLYYMIYPFDISPWHVYIPLVCSNYWVGLVVVSTVGGEINMLGECLMHLNARYELLRRDLVEARQRLLSKGDPSTIATQFYQTLTWTMQKNARLNHFADDVQRITSFCLFITFALSTATLCALTYKNPAANVPYIFWFIAKTVELMAYGNFGTIISSKRDEVSSMYYECGWEEIVLRSSNTCENVRLMKLVMLAIELNQNTFTLTGLKYFSIKLPSVVKILQGALSYFTFLISKQ